MGDELSSRLDERRREGKADVELEAGVGKAKMTNNLRSLPYSPVTTVFVTGQSATRGHGAGGRQRKRGSVSRVHLSWETRREKEGEGEKGWQRGRGGEEKNK